MALADVIGNSWASLLEAEFESEYMQKIARYMTHIRQTRTVYPDKEDVFRALKLCPFDRVKVVIIGKEPYYQGNADGLAFSYKDGIRQGQGMQSLDVILDEIEHDCYDGFNVNRSYQLDYLAKQGVLLLNSVLTVFKGQVGSHMDFGWQRFTSEILKNVVAERTPKVFMIWGQDAHNTFYNATGHLREHGIHYYDHLVLNAKHPAYDLHKRDTFGRITVKYPDGFTGCGHFSWANRYLLDHQRPAIDWFPVEINTHIENLSDQLPF